LVWGAVETGKAPDRKEGINPIPARLEENDNARWRNGRAHRSRKKWGGVAKGPNVKVDSTLVATYIKKP